MLLKSLNFNSLNSGATVLEGKVSKNEGKNGFNYVFCCFFTPKLVNLSEMVNKFKSVINTLGFSVAV